MKQLFLVLSVLAPVLLTGCGESCEVNEHVLESVERVEMRNAQNVMLLVRNTSTQEVWPLDLNCEQVRILTDGPPNEPIHASWKTVKEEKHHRQKCGMCEILTIHVSDINLIRGPTFQTVQ